MSWIRRSLEREREETARLAVVAERMRIARDLHDAAGHGVTAISLQAAAGLRPLEEDGDTDEARTTGSIAVGSRRGLIGMRERVELFGGRFSAGPMERGGFRVFARLPVSEALENLSQAR
jgi:signal transduction histidine kinase